MKRLFAALSILAASISLAHAAPTGGSALNERALNPQPLPPARSSTAPRTPPRPDLASLNPQPLPPVERGRRGAVAGDHKTLPNGIIIVGGKNGGAR